MAGIYQRDNLNLQAALADALNRRQNYRDRQNQRIMSSIDQFGKLAETAGRTYEVGFTPEDDDNPEYRAARERYITTGDRSGLYQYEAAKRAKAEAEAQRAFQASENEKNRAFQAAEGAANRAIQREQHGLNKVIERAKMLRDYNTQEDIINDIDTNTSNYGTRAGIERAKAVNTRNMLRAQMLNSGMFSEADFGPVQVPFKGGYVPGQEAQDASVQASADSVAESAAKLDWNSDSAKIAGLLNEKKYHEAKNLLNLYKDSNDAGLQKDYNAYLAKANNGIKAEEDYKRSLNTAKEWSKTDQARQQIISAIGDKDKYEGEFPYGNGKVKVTGIRRKPPMDTMIDVYFGKTLIGTYDAGI